MKSIKLRVFVAVLVVISCACQAFGSIWGITKDAAKDAIIDIAIDVAADLIDDFLSTDEQMFFKTAQRGGDVTQYLKKGIDVNIKDEAGRTPLFYAANHGRLNTAKTLIVAGADVSVKDKYGKRARDYASNDEIRKALDASSGIWSWIKKHWIISTLIVLVGLIFIGAH